MKISATRNTVIFSVNSVSPVVMRSIKNGEEENKGSGEITDSGG